MSSLHLEGCSDTAIRTKTAICQAEISPPLNLGAVNPSIFVGCWSPGAVGGSLCAEDKTCVPLAMAVEHAMPTTTLANAFQGLYGDFTRNH